MLNNKNRMATVFYVTKPDDPLKRDGNGGTGTFISGPEVWFDPSRGDTNTVDIINVTRDTVSNVLHPCCRSNPNPRLSNIKIYTSYGEVQTLGIAASGQVRLRRVTIGRESVYIASGDVFIESIPESHPVQYVSRTDFQRLVQSVRVRDTELTSEIEGLKVQNAKLESEIDSLKSLIQEMQVKNAVTESMFMKKFGELCDVVEDVIDQNTSLRIQTQMTTDRRNPFDE